MTGLDSGSDSSDFLLADESHLFQCHTMGCTNMTLAHIFTALRPQLVV